VVLAEAEDAIGRALALDPVNPHNLRLAGTFYLETAETTAGADAAAARIRAALPLFERAAGLAPAYPDAYADWARACYRLGDEAGASELMARALRAGPSRVRAEHGPFLRALGLDR
jgi:tetratricopeptide (TPR) repeat protein